MNNAICLVTVKMGMVIPISHGNLQITNYRGKYRYFTVVILPRIALELKDAY